MPGTSANPITYLSPLWTVLGILFVIAVVAYFVLKPLHRYLTDRKTARIIAAEKAEDEKGAAGQGAPQGGEPGAGGEAAGESGKDA